jgi:prolyl-tRNA synthetase
MPAVAARAMADLPDKSTAFIDWYLAAVEAANLTDKRYPVKGMNVWTPYGLQARRQLDAVMIEAIESTGSVPVEFPTLIPQTEFQKEKEHIKGFDAQVYWVTRGGATELDIPLVLRPTSETAMYPIFAVWIRSHKDLPLNVYQIVNTFRYETKTTRPFLRVREIHFFEEHTCQVDEAAATARVVSNLEAFRAMAAKFCLPYLAIRRPEWDKFPGAYYSVALDIPVGLGRSLQIGSIHHYRENFSGPYGIGFEAVDGSRHLVHQTTFGLSERLIGAVVSVHGDSKGVVFPASMAPVQVAIVPIPGKGGGTEPLAMARELATRLSARGFRVKVDDSEERPGAKYYRWETLGAPLRLEIGAREALAGTVSAVSRLGTRSVLGPADLEGAVARSLADGDVALRARAEQLFATAFAEVRNLDGLKGLPAIAQLSWCGSEECGHRIEAGIEGALLGTPEGAPPLSIPGPGPCVACASTTGTRWALAARPL